jgi:hypothetical protein
LTKTLGIFLESFFANLKKNSKFLIPKKEENNVFESKLNGQRTHVLPSSTMKRDHDARIGP